MKVAVAIGRFGVGILSGSNFLIAFSGYVDMKVVKSVALDAVGVLVTLTVVATQPEQSVGVRNTHCHDN